MNDEHRDNASGNGWSSRTENGSTATAEPVDRRWFEEALRSQGFLVEPPAAESDDAWRGSLAVEPTTPAIETDDEPLPVEPLDMDADPELVSPVAEVRPELVAPVAEVEPELEPLASAAESDTQPWDTVVSPVTVAPPVPDTVWPVIGQTPARVALSSAVVPAPNAPATAAATSSARQPVAPTTLAAGSSPVPPASLAVRLSRSATPTPVAAPRVPEAPAEVSAEVSGATSDDRPVAAPDPPSESAPAPASIPPAYGWTLPAVAVEPPAALDSSAQLGSSALLGSSAQVDTAMPSTVDALAADEDRGDIAAATLLAAAALNAVAAPAVDDASSAEMTARAEADLQAQLSAQDVAQATHAVADAELQAQASAQVIVQPTGVPAVELDHGTADPVSPAIAVATAAAVAAPSVGPFTPPTAGIATVAPRPPGATIGTTVDGGDSDLWGLVSDPRKAAAAASAPTAEPPASRVANIALTLIVAFVVVVLVLGFLYLLTELL